MDFDTKGAMVGLGTVVNGLALYQLEVAAVTLGSVIGAGSGDDNWLSLYQLDL